VITQVALAHYGEFFPEGIASIARAKGEIFSSSKLKKAIFYSKLDASVINELQVEKLSYSLEDTRADYFLQGDVVKEKGKEGFSFKIPFCETHNHHNFLGSIAIARALEMEWSEIAQQVEKIK